MNRAVVACLLLKLACAAADNSGDTLSLLQVGLGRRLPHAYFWAGKNGDLSRTGASRFTAPRDVSVKPTWSFDAGLVRAAPLIDAQKNIYLSTIRGEVYKMTKGGGTLWHYQADSSLPGVPAIANGLLFTASTSGFVVALDMATGVPRWSTKVAPFISGDTWSVTADASVVAVPVKTSAALNNNEVVVLDARNGSIRWRFRPDTPVYNLLAAIIDDSLVFSDASGRTYRLDLANGRVLWKFNATSLLDFSTGGAVVGPNRVVYVTSNVGNQGNVQSSVGRGRLTALSVDTGARLWYQDTHLQSNNAPAVGHLHPSGGGGLSVVVGVGENPDMPPQRSGQKVGKVFAFDASTGRRLDWSFSLPVWGFAAAAGDTLFHTCLPDAFSNPAIGGDGTVYIGFEDGHLYAMRDADGDGRLSASEVSSHNFGNAFQGSPGIAPGMLVATPCNGMHVFMA
mmetsp:Transcript_135945/g.422339  ORF Transcript_135945/g.422339 Transcript_135945/m.422339 type:complete len:453 (+) Transcript_135945:59-1417(+)